MFWWYENKFVFGIIFAVTLEILHRMFYKGYRNRHTVFQPDVKKKDE